MKPSRPKKECIAALILPLLFTCSSAQTIDQGPRLPSLDGSRSVPQALAHSAGRFGPSLPPGALSQFPRHGLPPLDPHEIANHLTLLETEIGIRANQLDAWRDFTASLLAVTKPPRLPFSSLANVQASGSAPRPFEREQRLAEDALTRTRDAELLLKSIEVLRTKLTPEQLAKVSDSEVPPRLLLPPSPLAPSFPPESR